MIVEIILGIVGAVVVLFFLPILIPIALLILFLGGVLLAGGLLIESDELANLIVVVLLAIPILALATFFFAMLGFLRDEISRNHNLRLTILKLLLRATPTIGTDAQLRKIARIKSVDERQESLEKIALEKANHFHDEVCARLESEIAKVLEASFDPCLIVDIEKSDPIQYKNYGYKWSIPERHSSVKISIDRKESTNRSVCEISITTKPYSSNQCKNNYKILDQYRTSLFESESTQKLAKWVKKAIVKFAKKNPEYASQLVKN